MPPETFWKRRDIFLESQSAVGLRLKRILKRKMKRALKRALQQKVWYDTYGILWRRSDSTPKSLNHITD